MMNQVLEIAHAVKNLSRKLASPTQEDMQDLKQCVSCTLEHSDEWLCRTVRDKQHKSSDVATSEVHTDTDWAGNPFTKKSTSSVFMVIDGFTVGMNAQQDVTLAQSSGESEFYALGAGPADGWHVRAVPSDLGLQANINLMCAAKAGRASEQRQGLSERIRHLKSYEVEVFRVPAETNLADIGAKFFPSHRSTELDGEKV